ncbi:hypothetical protein ACJX0J_020752, partial [Zea mays]
MGSVLGAVEEVDLASLKSNDAVEKVETEGWNEEETSMRKRSSGENLGDENNEKPLKVQDEQQIAQEKVADWSVLIDIANKLGVNLGKDDNEEIPEASSMGYNARKLGATNKEGDLLKKIN